MIQAIKSVALILMLVAGSSPLRAQVVVHDIPSPSANATGLTWDGSALWVSDYSSTIYKVNPASGAVIRTLTGPANGSRGLAYQDGHLWTISRQTGVLTVFKIDTISGAVVHQFPDPTAARAGGLTWDGSALWFSAYYPAPRLLRINPAAGDTLSLLNAPGANPWGVAWDGASLWNCSEDAGFVDRVYRINPANGQTQWSFVLPPHTPPASRRPRGMAWDGQYLWILAFEQTTWNVRIYKYDVGNADNPDIDFTISSRDFGGHVVGYPVTWSTFAANRGNIALRLDSARFAIGTAFTLLAPAAFPVNIAARDSVPMTIRFNPPAAGEYRDSLCVYSNDPDENPAYLRVTGTGLPDEGDIDLFPEAISFGGVRIRSPLLSSSRPLEIHNLGTGTLTITQIVRDGDPAFSWDPVTLPLAIDSFGMHTLRVWFDPTADRGYAATLLIFSDDPDEPIAELPVSGWGDATRVDSGQVLWFYEASGGWDHSINAVTGINDVNGDGVADAVAAAGNYLIYCLNGSSTSLADTFWTFHTGLQQNHTGIVYYERGLTTMRDITGDGVEEVIIGTAGASRSVYAISGADGTELWMFDTREWGGGGWVYEVYPIPDVNGDLVGDVLGAAGDDGSGTGPRRVFCVSGANGQLIWQGNPSAAFFTVRTVRDVTGDNVPDVVAGNTDGGVYGYSGTDGAPIWSATVGSGSPVFALLNMGNANPGQTQTEDVAVASAYRGVYCLDGGNGAQIWFRPHASNVYELAVGGDITGDDVNEVYFGTVSGYAICLDGASGQEIWSVIADPWQARNVLAMTAIPDVTGDGIRDIVCGTLGSNIVMLSGWDGERVWSTIGLGPASAVDALGILRDVDGSGSWEILAGHREGLIEAISGGWETYVQVAPAPESVQDFALGAAYPNPFNAQITIPFTVAAETTVSLKVYDVLGREVAVLADQPHVPGRHSVTWRAANTGSGVYFVRMTAGNYSSTIKIMLLR